VILDELQDLVGNHIDKIYQLTRDELLIRVKNVETKQKESIFIRNGKLISVTQKEFDKPLKPTTFAMTLRKYLQNGKITEISQHEFDRIIKIKVGKKEGEYTLIIEFFSDGNIILANPNEKIIIPLIRQTWAHRSIKGREPYVPPPSRVDPFDLSKEEFLKLLNESDSDLVRTLAVNLNLSGAISEEICKRADIKKNVKIEEIDDLIISETYNALVEFLDLFKKKKFDPVVVKKDGEAVDILPFEFKSYSGVDFEKVSSFTRSLELFIEKQPEMPKKESKTEIEIERLNRQHQQQKDIISKLEKEIELKKIEGDLIYLHYQEIEQLLNQVKKTLELKDKENEILKINKISIVKRFDPVENILITNLADTTGKVFDVKLNFRKSVSENAEKAYADNKKLRNKLKGAEEAIIKTNKQIELVKKKIQDEKKEDIKVSKKEKLHWFEKFRWFISSNDNIIIGGKDEKTNEIIVKKYLKEGDRYAHADIQGAPSIIIKRKGLKDEAIDVLDETLEEACIFAASYSKAWKQFAEAQAYWVLPEQVSKTAQSGEFIPRGAFVIRGKRNYHRCKLEIAVGEVEIEGEKKIMGGPVSAVKKRSNKYIVLVPGAVKKVDIARKLSKIFNVNVETVDRVLPPGGVTVLEKVGVEL
jgi:predicted ribosome quality control (RQC) complex YloA/Tae2 family protein